MRKYRADDFWFEITTAPAPDGTHARYYAISCRKCSNHASYHASGTSNEGLKKIFIRAGWTIGKTRFKHFCPECTQRHNAHSSPAPATPPPATAHHTSLSHIQDVWARLDDDQRIEFWHWLHENYACWLDNNGRVKLIDAQQQLRTSEALEQFKLYEKKRLEQIAAEHGRSDDLQAKEQALIDERDHLRDLLAAEPSPSPSPSPADTNDDDVADWWKELTAKRDG